MTSVPATLRILLVEDMPADAKLVLWALRRMPAAIEHVRVADEAAMRDALAIFRPNLILSDFEMPGFGGNRALAIASEVAPEVPFVFVSGTMGEQVAIDALQSGAVDFVLKDNLRHLPSAIERALRVSQDRVERHRMQRALADSEARFRAIVESSKDWIWECGIDARITYSNDAIEHVLGYGASDFLGQDACAHLTERSRRDVEERLPRHVADRTGWRDWRLCWLHRDGSERVLESTGMPLFDGAGQLVGFRGVAQDITGRLRHEARIIALARIHEVLADLAKAVLNAANRRELLADACRVMVETGGFQAAGIAEIQDGAMQVVASHGDDEILRAVRPDGPMSLDAYSPYHDHPGIRAFREGRRIAIADFATGDVPADLRREMLACGLRSQVALPIGSPAWGMLALYSRDEFAYDEKEVALLERLADEIDHALEFLGRSEREQYLAYHHSATGLPNAAAFDAHLRQCTGDAKACVAAIEVLRLAHVSATRGRPYADRLLRMLGERLRQSGAFLALVEGARFLLAYATPGSPDEAADALDATLREIEATPLAIDDELVRLPLRAGLFVATADERQGESLESNAITALARAAERDLHVCLYDDRMRRQALREVQLERDLHHALERNEFELHYQPKCDARRRVTGAEALLRWRHPREGLVSPGEFIPLLEQTGLIVPVGLWVMREALDTAFAWRARHHPGFRIAVNVSARELRQRTFLEERQALLAAHAGDQVVDIEVTESLLMDDMERCVPLLQAMRELGCRVAIDDFGTGYSSLNYLVRLPVDTIKIDRSFVVQLADSPETMALTTNVIALAHSLGLDTIAEGVETEDQARLLHLLRCDAMQGYLLGRPMPAEEFVAEVFAPRSESVS